MPTIHACERCGFTTEYKSSLFRHLKAKQECQPLNSSLSRDTIIENMKKKEYNEVTHQCDFCDAKFNTSQSKYRHQKMCKNRANNNLIQVIEKLQQEIQDLKHAYTASPTQIINNTNINNGIQIVINEFGKENTNYLTKDFVTRCLKKKNEGLIDLIRAIHFNPDHKENHNLRITNKKLPYIEKFLEERWRYEDKDKIIDELIREGFEILDEHHYDNEEELKQLMTRRIYEDLDKWLSQIRDKEKDVITPLKRDLYLVVLNNSYMILSK
jgi:hypothetical protein